MKINPKQVLHFCAHKIKTKEAYGLKKAIDALRSHKWEIDSIDGEEIYGFCETCDQPITADEPTENTGEDGPLICADCAGKQAQP